MEENIKNQTIIDIKIYNVNENYIEFNNGYSIDGAIEIHLKEKIITIGWNFEHECYDYREIPYSEPLNYHELDINEFYKIKNLIGKKLKSLKIIKTEFEVIVDYTMRTEKEKIITGYEIEFNNDFNVKVSISSFEINAEKRIPQNITPNIQGNILIDIGYKYEYNNIG
ncbi:hypothetical protein, partial [Polaribacter uvawellassae]|uniref:hypothetical protein n=1 Tax=Polaribacter uvawellassae TaxID=3133495 RepID=UPI00321A03AC